MFKTHVSRSRAGLAQIATLAALSLAFAAFGRVTASYSSEFDRAASILAKVQADPALAATVPEKYRKNGFVDVHIPDGPPMGFVPAAGGESAGSDVDVIRAIAKVLDLKVTFTVAGFDALIPGLQSGRYDTGSVGLSDTAAREKIMDLLRWVQYGQGIGTMKGGRAVTFDDACGASFGVLNGSAAQKYIEGELAGKCDADGKPKPTVSIFPNPPAMMLAVSSGRVDAAMTTGAVVAYYVGNSNGALTVSDNGLHPEFRAIMVGKETGLSDPFLAAMKKLYADGVLDQILTIWNMDAKAVEPAKNAFLAAE